MTNTPLRGIAGGRLQWRDTRRQVLLAYQARVNWGVPLVDVVRRPDPPVMKRRVVAGDVLPAPRHFRRELWSPADDRTGRGLVFLLGAIVGAGALHVLEAWLR